MSGGRILCAPEDVTCLGCGLIFTRTNRARTYCTHRCCNRAARRRHPERERIKARKFHAKVAATQGKQCRWCHAQDGECTFTFVYLCRPCERARVRASCPRCGGPCSGRERGCVRCDDPGTFTRVVLMNDTDDRERLLWRRRVGGRRRVSVSGRLMQIPPGGEDIICEVPLKTWVRTRM